MADLRGHSLRRMVRALRESNANCSVRTTPVPLHSAVSSPITSTHQLPPRPLTVDGSSRATCSPRDRGPRPYRWQAGATPSTSRERSTAETHTAPSSSSRLAPSAAASWLPRVLGTTHGPGALSTDTGEVSAVHGCARHLMDRRADERSRRDSGRLALPGGSCESREGTGHTSRVGQGPCAQPSGSARPRRREASRFLSRTVWLVCVTAEGAGSPEGGTRARIRQCVLSF
jgi:hypothetical protein